MLRTRGELHTVAQGGQKHVLSWWETGAEVVHTIHHKSGRYSGAERLTCSSQKPANGFFISLREVLSRHRPGFLRMSSEHGQELEVPCSEMTADPAPTGRSRVGSLVRRLGLMHYGPVSVFSL